MIRTLVVVCLFTALGLTSACASVAAEPDPQVEAQELRRREQAKELEQRQSDIHLVLLNLDKVMDKYSEALTRSGYRRSDKLAVSLETYLRREVDKHFAELVRIADSTGDPTNRARAVAAIGFSERPEALDPLLNALASDDDTIVTNAAFALAILRDERTPISRLGEIAEDTSRPAKTRIGAAWSLVRCQDSVPNPERALPSWLRIVSESPGEVDPWILVQAVRGIGRLRDPENAAVVAELIDHPAPLVRQSVAVSLGFMGNPDSHVALLTRLAPEETNSNVRLAARKALQALAGGIDRGYDVKEWLRVFDRGGDG